MRSGLPGHCTLPAGLRWTVEELAGARPCEMWAVKVKDWEEGRGGECCLGPQGGIRGAVVVVPVVVGRGSRRM